MNWTVWGPVLGTLAGTVVAAFLGLLGLIFKTRKDHHAALEQIDATRKQSDAALTQAQAALESSKASARVAQATADAAVQDAFTRAYNAASQNWARFCDANDRTIDNLRELVAENTERVDQAEIRAEAYRQERDRADANLRVAMAWIRRVLRWLSDVLPGANYPPLPPELDLHL